MSGFLPEPASEGRNKQGCSCFNMVEMAVILILWGQL